MAQARRRKAAGRADVPRLERASSGLALLLVGFFIGLITTTLYFGFRSEQPGDIGSGIRDLLERSKKKSAVTAVPPGPAGQYPALPPTADPEPAIEAPTLEFFTVLPNIESVIPEGIQVEPEVVTVDTRRPAESNEKTYAADTGQAVKPEVVTRTTQTGPAQTDTKEKSFYMLQAASFKQADEAERLKARLTLSGLSVKVQKVNVGDKGIFYRVQVGPFDQISKLDTANGKLKELGINAMRLKVSQAG